MKHTATVFAAAVFIVVGFAILLWLTFKNDSNNEDFEDYYD